MSSPQMRDYFEAVSSEIDSSLKRIKEYDTHLKGVVKLEEGMQSDCALVALHQGQLDEHFSNVFSNLLLSTQKDTAQRFKTVAQTLDMEFQLEPNTTQVKQLVGYTRVQLPLDTAERKAYLQAAFMESNDSGRSAIASGNFIEGLRIQRMVVAIIPTANTTRQRDMAFHHRDYAVIMNLSETPSKHSNVSFSHLLKSTSNYANVDSIVFPLALTEENILVSTPDIVAYLKAKEDAKELDDKGIVMKELLDKNGFDPARYQTHSFWEGVMKESKDNTVVFTPHAACMDFACVFCYSFFRFESGVMRYHRLFGQKMPPTPTSTQ